MINKIANKLGYTVYKSEFIPKPRSPFTHFPVANALRKFLYFQKIYNQISHLDGDIVECGVGHGASLMILSVLAEDENKQRKLWGFDSFEGFPQPSAEDKSNRNPQEGEWSDTSIEFIANLFQEFGIPSSYFDSQIVLMKGFFNESLKKYIGEKIALLHLDVDLYQSYKDCLTQLYDKVVPGGIILFDEFLDTKSLSAFPGASQAILEFFNDKQACFERDGNSGRFYFRKPEV